MRGRVDPPEVPKELEPAPITLDGTGMVRLDGAYVEPSDSPPERARSIGITESELRGITLQSEPGCALRLRDVRMRGCELSNVDAAEASLSRVEISSSRMLGFRVPGAELRDVRIVDCALGLASFAFARLRNVHFEGADLSEASFLEAQMDGVAFIDCRLGGTDFRRARLTATAIRGTSLDGVLGIDSLRGLRMPWSDVVASAAALATALGIVSESDDANEPETGRPRR